MEHLHNITITRYEIADLADADLTAHDLGLAHWGTAERKLAAQSQPDAEAWGVRLPDGLDLLLVGRVAVVPTNADPTAWCVGERGLDIPDAWCDVAESLAALLAALDDSA